MRVLLVEPDYRRTSPKLSGCQNSAAGTKNDETLWYPPLGLMKLSRFHKDRGDEVCFVRGCDPTVFSDETLFDPAKVWDRVYITTLFTFHFDKIIKTINFYLKAVGETVSKIYVGGIMASLMPEAIFEETNVRPILGILNSPSQIDLEGDVDIDLLTPDYDILDDGLYAISDTYYAYSTRGCSNKCPWCGVPILEPKYEAYIDIKPVIRELRKRYGDKPALKLMDNNVLASRHLKRIVDDLITLGYGKDQYTNTQPRKKRVIDFNQGLDARLLTENRMKLLAKLNIKPMRIAFDKLSQQKSYEKALEIARRHGVLNFSNYMLYNCKDTPSDLYKRLCLNIKLNKKWKSKGSSRTSACIYSYPMRYAPITDTNGQKENRSRDILTEDRGKKRSWLKNPAWTKRFIRNIEIMKGASHGAIPPRPDFAQRAIGADFTEFVANLYMPEELLRNRNKYEEKVYPGEPRRKRGTGDIERFRTFIVGLLEKRDKCFWDFHRAVSENSVQAIRGLLWRTKDKELQKWLEYYLRDDVSKEFEPCLIEE